MEVASTLPARTGRDRPRPPSPPTGSASAVRSPSPPRRPRPHPRRRPASGCPSSDNEGEVVDGLVGVQQDHLLQRDAPVAIHFSESVLASGEEGALVVQPHLPHATRPDLADQLVASHERITV